MRPGDEGGEAEKALELEAYNRTTGGTPINWPGLIARCSRKLVRDVG